MHACIRHGRGAFYTSKQNMRIRSADEKLQGIINVHATEAASILAREIEFRFRPLTVFIVTGFTEVYLLQVFLRERVPTIALLQLIIPRGSRERWEHFAIRGLR